MALAAAIVATVLLPDRAFATPGRLAAEEAETQNFASCSWSNWPYVNCMRIYHGESPLYVARIRVWRSGLPSSRICNWWARVVVTYPSGAYAAVYTSPIHYGCLSYVAIHDFYPNRWFPSGSEACLYFFVDYNRLTSGHPCATIHD